MVSLECVCKIRAPFLANESAASFPAIWQCPGIHCSTISLLLICCSCMWNVEGLGHNWTVLVKQSALSLSEILQCDGIN